MKALWILPLLLVGLLAYGCAADEEETEILIKAGEPLLANPSDKKVCSCEGHACFCLGPFSSVIQAEGVEPSGEDQEK